MGIGGSSTWQGYDAQLLKDSVQQSCEVENSEEKGATAIRRHPEAKNGFKMYLTDDETKSEIDSGWKCTKVALKKYADRELFGYRPFTDPTNDISKRGKYKWDTYKTVGEQIYGAGKGLRSLGLGDKVNVGIFAINRSEWMIAHLANWNSNFRTVALYDTLGAQAVQYIVWHAELSVIFVEKNKLPQLFEAIKSCGSDRSLKLKYIIQFDYQKKYNNQHENVEQEAVNTAKELNIELIGLSQLFERGKNKKEEKEQPPSYDDANKEDDTNKGDNADNDDNADNADDTNTGDDSNKADDTNKGDDDAADKGDEKKNDDDDDDALEEVMPAPDDLAYIMYTSGTTGDPKGVLLTHRCFAATVASATRGLAAYGKPINKDDAHVSYLPLAHSFESAIITCCVSSGAKAAFWAGNIKTIARDWKEIRPTIMFGVPRIYNKTYDKVQLKVKQAGGAKEWLFGKAKVSSSDAIRKGQRSGFYDSLIWGKICEEIGFDRVRILASGAAPLPPHIAEFLRIVCSKAVVVQGYGLTESCAVSFFTGFKDLNLGHVGIPVDNIEYRLVDAPECEYFVADKPHPRGEIQLRGPTVMDGYYKNEEATKKSLSSDKWFSTGDIGRINPNGTLSIVDRRKNMFKTAMGEYIASEKVENEYSKSAACNQIWIYGNSFKSFVVAVIVPDPLWLVPILKEKGKWVDEKPNALTPATEPYCKKFKKIVDENYDLCYEIMKKDINDMEKNSDLKKFEKIRDFLIESEVDNLLQGFNVPNNTLTPTFKKKRPQLLKKYVEKIKELYTKNGEAPNENENW